MSNVTVLGATGGIGRAITTELATRDHQVTAVNRGSVAALRDPIRTVTADLRDRGQALFATAGADVVVMAAGRLSDYYGPHATNSMLRSLAIEPAARGKNPKALLDPDQPHTFHYLPDVARAFTTLAEHPTADGRVWILPAAPAITQRELMTEIVHQLRGAAEVGRISPLMLTIGGLFDRQIRETRELAYQWTRPFTTDGSAFEVAFGPFATTAHVRAIAATIAGPPHWRGPTPAASPDPPANSTALSRAIPGA